MGADPHSPARRPISHCIVKATSKARVTDKRRKRDPTTCCRRLCDDPSTSGGVAPRACPSLAEGRRRSEIHRGLIVPRMRGRLLRPATPPRLITEFCGASFHGHFHRPDPPSPKDFWSRAEWELDTLLPYPKGTRPNPLSSRSSSQARGASKPRACEGLPAEMMVPRERRW